MTTKTQKRQLPQIAIFPISPIDIESTERHVNDYVIEAFNENGNCPIIEVTSSHITVIVNKLLEVER